MSGVKPLRFIRQAHRWLGLIVGLQVLLWVIGGLVMSSLRLEEVRGEHLMATEAAPPLAAGTELIPVSDLLARHRERQPSAVTLNMLLDRPIYRIDGRAGSMLVDAQTGDVLSPLSARIAAAVGQADYVGTGRLAGLDWVDAPAIEYRGHELPLWRVRFDDELGTALYISPFTGKVVARRNDLWRAFDLVWMLHIMDYRERENFNHPLLVTTAATALLFVLTGLIMLLYSFRPLRQPLLTGMRQRPSRTG